MIERKTKRNLYRNLLLWGLGASGGGSLLLLLWGRVRDGGLVNSEVEREREGRDEGNEVEVTCIYIRAVTPEINYYYYGN